MNNEKTYELNDILQEAQNLFVSNSMDFLNKRDYKKIREETIYVVLFLKGQKKYYKKQYKIKESENPDCIAIDELTKKIILDSK
jgi:hypothetical protein